MYLGIEGFFVSSGALGAATTIADDGSTTPSSIGDISCRCASRGAGMTTRCAVAKFPRENVRRAHPRIGIMEAAAEGEGTGMRSC